MKRKKKERKKGENKARTSKKIQGKNCITGKIEMKEKIKKDHCKEEKVQKKEKGCILSVFVCLCVCLTSQKLTESFNTHM